MMPMLNTVVRARILSVVVGSSDGRVAVAQKLRQPRLTAPSRATPRALAVVSILILAVANHTGVGKGKPPRPAPLPAATVAAPVHVLMPRALATRSLPHLILILILVPVPPVLVLVGGTLLEPDLAKRHRGAWCVCGSEEQEKRRVANGVAPVVRLRVAEGFAQR